MGKEIVAMILAGGRGTRLKELTAKVAKPAVHFGGKYRIIDFPCFPPAFGQALLGEL